MITGKPVFFDKLGYNGAVTASLQHHRPSDDKFCCQADRHGVLVNCSTGNQDKERFTGIWDVVNRLCCDMAVKVIRQVYQLVSFLVLSKIDTDHPGLDIV